MIAGLAGVLAVCVGVRLGSQSIQIQHGVFSDVMQTGAGMKTIGKRELEEEVSRTHVHV